VVSSLNKVASPLVLDASVAINIATAAQRQAILKSIPNEVLITEIALDELRVGATRGRENFQRINELIRSNDIRVVGLQNEAEEIFQSLVFGSTVETLDDGEAATLAYCAASTCVALTDDGKAVQLAKRRFPALAVAHSIDLLAHPHTVAAFDPEVLSDLVFSVVQSGRMKVFPQHLAWVTTLLGPDRCSQCPSLPQSVRTTAGVKR
jgi:predicted nucleic acid-binding protein